MNGLHYLIALALVWGVFAIVEWRRHQRARRPDPVRDELRARSVLWPVAGRGVRGLPRDRSAA